MSKAAPTAQAGDDQIGVFPSKYDTDALPVRRTAAFARILAIIAAVEAFAIIALAFAIAALLPLQKVVPMVVTSNAKGDEVVHINPATFTSPTSDYVSEISLRNFVSKRNSISSSAAEQAANWGQGSPVQLMSGKEVYTAWMAKARAENERLRVARLTRTVRIDAVSKLNDTTWQVDWVSNDIPDPDPMSPGQPTQGDTKAWRSTITISFDPKNVRYSDRLNNPFGVTVTSISDARRD
jgi:type IV secretory pathway component VirB8